MSNINAFTWSPFTRCKQAPTTGQTKVFLPTNSPFSPLYYVSREDAPFWLIRVIRSLPLPPPHSILHKKVAVSPDAMVNLFSSFMAPCICLSGFFPPGSGFFSSDRSMTQNITNGGPPFGPPPFYIAPELFRVKWRSVTFLGHFIASI